VSLLSFSSALMASEQIAQQCPHREGRIPAWFRLRNDRGRGDQPLRNCCAICSETISALRVGQTLVCP